MSNVVGFDGNEVPVPGEPVQAVVDHLEELLARAKAGQVHCIVEAVDTPDGVLWSIHGTAMGFDMIGGLEMAKARIIRLMGD